MSLSRAGLEVLDAADPLAPLRERFVLPDGVIYLDGNSLGALPRATAGRIAEVIGTEWGHDLITSWNKAGWIDLPQRVGEELTPFDGPQVVATTAAPETVVRHTSVLHLEVGRTLDDPAADWALIQLTFTTQGYVSSTVPSAGPACVLAMGLAVMGLRRSRRRD